MSTTKAIQRHNDRRRRPDSRPQELLDAALTVFAERGYHNTRIDDVADAAGVTKGAVYHYFATKEDLLLRAIESHHDRTFAEIDDLLRDAGGPVSARIRLMVRKAFGAGAAGQRVRLALILQGVRHDVPVAHHQWLRGGPIKGWRLLTTLIEEGKQTGEFRSDADAEVAARIIISGIITQLVWQPLKSDIPDLAIDRDRLIDSTLDLLLRGLMPAAVVAQPLQ
jgi:AcrR family transcriptional regulator